MRKLEYHINLKHLKKIKDDLVPTLFTEHQFELIEKKFTNKKMTFSEKNEFSRTVSRKMKAINKILEKETGGIFVYGKEKILDDRLILARKHIKHFSRKFKNKHIFITGSFLYQKKYNDIDVFVISKYEKEDYKDGKFHINYLTEDVYYSLFFASIRRLCISNKKIESSEIKEKVNLDTFISLYQELFNDLDKNFKGIRKTFREFLLQAAFLKKSSIPDSFELRQQIDALLKVKNPKEIIKNIFIESVVLTRNKTLIQTMKKMVQSYKSIIKEYKQHKGYYLDLVEAFKGVIAIES